MPLQITAFAKMIGTFVFSVAQPEMGFGFVSSFKPPLPATFLWLFLTAWPWRSSAGISLGRSTKNSPRGVLHVLRALHVQMWGLWGHVVLF